MILFPPEFDSQRHALERLREVTQATVVPLELVRRLFVEVPPYPPAHPDPPHPNLPLGSCDCIIVFEYNCYKIYTSFLSFSEYLFDCLDIQLRG